MRQLIGRPFRVGQSVTLDGREGVFVFRQYAEYTHQGEDTIPLQGVVDLGNRYNVIAPLGNIHAVDEAVTSLPGDLPESTAV
jgi:hypothetical protein